VAWGARNEVPGVVDLRLLLEDCRENMGQKLRFSGNTMAICANLAPTVYLLEGDIQGISISPRI